MNFKIDSENHQFTYNVDPCEYLYEDEDSVVILDLNHSKEKSDSINSKVLKWLANPTNHHAEDEFKGGYFILYLRKKDLLLKVYRDSSGIKTGYYNTNGSTLRVSNKLHDLARISGVTGFNDKAIAMLISLDFIFDGYTIYENIDEVKIGAEISFENARIKETKTTEIQFAKDNNTLDFRANVNKLREEINRTHFELSGAQNIVYLSGGLDSCVMLSALHDVVNKKDLQCVTFRVKGTNQDETVYAKSIAKHLNVSCEVKEIDPNAPIKIDDFESKILNLNNPYIGYWIFAPEGNRFTTYFAGQDTRLHTPDVNKLDNIVFDMYLKNQKVPLGNLLASGIGRLHKKYHMERSSFKALKHLDRISASLNPKEYILKYVFKHKELLKGTYLEDEVNNLTPFFELPGDIQNKRQLYNEIVRIKWKEQYTDDIRYMQDLARVSGTYIAMPFYDKQLSEFSSSIPFKYASEFKYGKDTFSNAKVKVNKLVLREAYKDKLNDEVLYRKKAVSATNFLLFGGAVGENIKTIIERDLSSEHSFIENYGLRDFINPFLQRNLSWKITDQNYLMKVYYIGTLCVYYKNIGT